MPWFEAGCSVVPIKRDGTKSPQGNWKALQRIRMSITEVKTVWASTPTTPGVAVICGKVSKNLEMLELEGPYTDADTLEAIELAAERNGMSELWRSLVSGVGYIEWTPSGGLHFLYRISDHDVPGNTKIAQAPDPTNGNLLKTRAETRGEGGYVIVAPTPGACHPSGDAWTALYDSTPADIPTLTWQERCALHEAIAEVLDESPPPPEPVEKRASLLATNGEGGLRPGDDFNLRATWSDILIPQGWTNFGNRGNEILWTRPGKDGRDGHSASTGYADDADRLYVWSTSAGLPSETPMSKFYVYTQLYHNGDFTAATRELSRLGFGGNGPTTLSAVSVATTPIDELELPHGEVPVRRPYHPAIRFTDVGNSYYMENMADGNIRYDSHRNKWFIYNGDGTWAIDPKGAGVKERLREWATSRWQEAMASGNAKEADECLKAMSNARINAAFELMKGGVHTTPDDWDRDKNLLNLRNGVYDLTTGELREHSPDDLMHKQMGAALDETAACPTFLDFLDEAVPEEEERRYLQKMVGYTLLGHPVERSMMILHGPGGTGKSTFIETLSKLFNDYGSTATDQVFRAKSMDQTGPTNDLHNLRGARYVSMSELDYGMRLDESLMKRMTGRDRITSRAMYEENQTWTPRCVIWMATNHLFRVNGDDGAIWDRIKVVRFHERPAQKNLYLADQLEDELDGILLWALEGLAMYRAEGLVEPEGVAQAVKDYRDEQDIVNQFIEEFIDTGIIARMPTARAEKSALYRMFRNHRTDQGDAFVMSQARFSRKMEALGFTGEKAGRMYWCGLSLTNPWAIQSIGEGSWVK